MPMNVRLPVTVLPLICALSDMAVNSPSTPVQVPSVLGCGNWPPVALPPAATKDPARTAVPVNDPEYDRLLGHPSHLSVAEKLPVDAPMLVAAAVLLVRWRVPPPIDAPVSSV